MSPGTAPPRVSCHSDDVVFVSANGAILFVHVRASDNDTADPLSNASHVRLRRCFCGEREIAAGSRRNRGDVAGYLARLRAVCVCVPVRRRPRCGAPLRGLGKRGRRVCGSGNNANGRSCAELQALRQCRRHIRHRDELRRNEEDVADVGRGWEQLIAIGSSSSIRRIVPRLELGKLILKVRSQGLGRDDALEMRHMDRF